MGVKLKPAIPTFWAARGEALLRLGDLDHAIGDFDQALKIAPDPVVYYDRARAKLEKHDFDSAAGNFSEVIARTKKPSVEAYAGAATPICARATTTRPSLTIAWR